MYLQGIDLSGFTLIYFVYEETEHYTTQNCNSLERPVNFKSHVRWGHYTTNQGDQGHS